MTRVFAFRAFFASVLKREVRFTMWFASGGIFNIGTFSDTVHEVHLTVSSITGTTGVLTSLTNYDVRL